MNNTQSLKEVGDLNRAKYIGSSDSAAILGVSPYQTALDVYLKKVAPIGDEDLWQTDPKQARIFEFGKHNEPLVLQYIERETGLKAQHKGKRYQHPKYDFICAEIDAETADGINIECKTSSQFMAHNWGRGGDDVPDYYLIQVQHALMVTGRDKCVLGALIGNSDFRVFEIERNQDLINIIEKKAVKFWEQVKERTPPSPANYNDVLKLYTTDNAQSTSADSAVIDLIDQLKHVQRELKSYIDLEKNLKEKIAIYMQDNAVLLDEAGNQLLTFKAQNTNRFNTTAFKTAHPDLYQQYLNTSTSRVMRIK